MMRFQLSLVLCRPNMALLFIAATCCLMDLTIAVCQWQVAVTSQESPFIKVAFAQDREPIVLLHDVSHNIFVNNLEKKEFWSFPYFLYLQVYCDGKLSPSVGRTIASSGVVPLVTVTHNEQHLANHHSGVVEYTLRGALVSVNDSVEPLGNAVELDQPAWLVPLIFDTHTRVMEIYVEMGGSGYEVNPTRHYVNIDGYHKLLSDDNSEYTSIWGLPIPIMQREPEAVLTGRPYEVIAVHGKTPTYVIGGIPESLAVILSNDEFSTFEALEIPLPNQTDNVCWGTPAGHLVIKQALALPDRILLNTPGGLYEGFGHYEGLHDAVGIVRNSPSRCYRQVMVPAQSRAANVHVLAIGESETRDQVFVAHVQLGVSLDFQELLEANGRGVCEVLNQMDGACTIISATASGTQGRAVLVLVEAGTSYHIAAYTGSTFQGGRWHGVSNFSVRQRSHSDANHDGNIAITGGESSSSEDSGDAAALYLRGMTFSGVISSHLFLWGRKLLHSPDAGASLYILQQYTSDANITLFTFSQDTGFALLNQRNELWYGVLGETIVLCQLRPSSGFSLFVSLRGEDGLEQTLGEEESLSVFFDLDNQLQELIASINSSTGTLTIRRRTIPIGDIIEHQEYVSTYNLVERRAIDSSIPPSCPYDNLHYEFSHLQLYARMQGFEFGAPYISSPNRLHTMVSLRVYQAIVHTMKTEDENVALEVHEFDTFDPFYHWRQRLLPLMSYNDYVFRNRLLGSQVAISPLEYVKLYNSGDAATTTTTTIPGEIFLDRQESFHFVIFLTIDQEYRSVTSSLDELMISVEVSDQELLEVTTVREMVHLNSSVKYQVFLTDKGSLETQSASGVDLHPVSVLIQVWNSPFKCFTHDDSAGNQLQGTNSLSIQLGCPPGRHLVFDISATLQRAKMLYDKIYDCPIPDAEYPCFYYKQGFSPIFRMLDLATGKSSLFTGQYLLSVIGGSVEGPANVEYFSSEQLQQYNQQNGSGPLIWKPEVSTHSNGSVPIFQHDHSGILWRCEQGSPCASVPINFPWPPEYYFVIQVTNREVDVESTYCEYTTRFIIKVHGLELSKYDLLAIVGWSLGLSWVIIGVFVICHRDKSTDGKRHPHKRKSKVAPMPTIQEVEISDESETEEVINIEEGRGFDDVPMGSSNLNRSTVLRVPGTRLSQYSTLQDPSSNPVILRQKITQL